ncbi:MAG: haloacid dehalogenase [Desulfobacterales bacterium]
MKKPQIDPAALAFDIDGVFADTMALFIDIARDEFNINGIKYEDITSYYLTECINMDSEIIEAIVTKIVDGNYQPTLRPFKNAPEVLSRLGMKHGSVLFVTARPYLGPIYKWMLNVLPLDPSTIEIIPTGSFEGKAGILRDKNISYFVEDRLETCFLLEAAGITPVLFKQPWNRQKHPFIEVDSWTELASLIQI